MKLGLDLPFVSGRGRHQRRVVSLKPVILPEHLRPLGSRRSGTVGLSVDGRIVIGIREASF
jgi:hypothetical protein